MSAHDGYQPGVPCWAAAVLPDAEAGLAFYTGLFGWEAADIMPPDGRGRYYVCTLRGRDVAAVGSGRGGEVPAVPAWGTYIWVDSADETAARASGAGGSVLAEPFDLGDAGRLAVLADPTGAVFCAFQPARLRGAQVVNEPGAWAMSALHRRPRGRRGLLRLAVRLGGRPDGPRRDGGQHVAPPRVPGRRARPAAAASSPTPRAPSSR